MKTVNKRTMKHGFSRDFFINREFNYIFGMPGCGKSTTLAVVAQVCYDMGIPCFSNFPVEHTYEFQGFDVNYPSGSVFIFDEIFELFGCGQSKSLPTLTTMFFREFRHSRYTVWAASQEEDDAARRIRGIITKSFQLSLCGISDKYTRLSECVLVERPQNDDGDKYEYVVVNSLVARLTDVKIYRPHFYSNFDSYCRRTFTRSVEFKPW